MAPLLDQKKKVLKALKDRKHSGFVAFIDRAMKNCQCLID